MREWIALIYLSLPLSLNFKLYQSYNQAAINFIKNADRATSPFLALNASGNKNWLIEVILKHSASLKPFRLSPHRVMNSRIMVVIVVVSGSEVEPVLHFTSVKREGGGGPN